MIHRRDTLRAEKIYKKQLEEKENVEFCWNSTVEKLICTERLTGVQLRNSKDHTMQELLCDGIFVSVGRNPATGLLQGQVTMDQPNCPFVLYVGTRKLVKRKEFEAYIRDNLII